MDIIQMITKDQLRTDLLNTVSETLLKYTIKVEG